MFDQFSGPYQNAKFSLIKSELFLNCPQSRKIREELILLIKSTKKQLNHPHKKMFLTRRSKSAFLRGQNLG